MVGSVDESSTPNPVRPLFVGRNMERSRLREQLDAVLDGHGRLVLVSGEAGIGKTSLVDDLARHAEAQGALVLWGHCYDLTVTPPYGPWVELARSYQPVDDLPAFPAFLHGGAALASVGSRETLFSQISEFFSSVALKRPLVLVLEDLHWADRESLDLLRVMARQLARHRVFLLVTYRDDELTRRHPLYQLTPLLVREANADRLGLQRLTDGDRHALIEQRYRLPEPDTTRLIDYLRTHAEGNPLYALELLRTLEQDKVLTESGDGWTLDDLTQVRVSPFLLQVIDGRLERLSDATCDLLEIASIIGQAVPVEIWQQVSQASDAALSQAVEEATEAHLLTETERGVVKFSHELIQQALYQRMVIVRRRGWHRQIGEALESSGAADPDAVAHHFTEAGDVRATRWLLNAGERAVRAYAWRTAVARFEGALAKLAEQHAPAVDRAVLLFRTAFLQRFLDTRRALTLAQEAYQTALEAGEPGLAAHCLCTMGLLQCWLGDLHAGLDAMQTARASYGSLSDGEQSRLWDLVGAVDVPFGGAIPSILAQSGRLQEAVDTGTQMLQETIAPPLRIGQGTSAYGDCLQGLGRAWAFLGQPHEARRALHQSTAIYQAIEHYQLVAIGGGFTLDWVEIPYFTNELEQRRRLASRVEHAAARSRGATWGDLPPRYLALPNMILEGSWQEARAIATACDDHPFVLYRFLGKIWQAELARNQGDVERAWKVIAEVVPDGPSTEPGATYVWAALPLLRLAARLALDAGDPATAETWIQAHERWLAWSGAVLGRADGTLLCAEFYRAAGDHAPARAFAGRSLSEASDPRQPLVLMSTHRFLGQLDREERNLLDAERHLRESLVLADACAAPFERALTLLALAELRIAQRRTDDARSLLLQARTMCEPLGALPTLNRIATLEAQRTASPETNRQRDVARLTPREVDVLRLVAQGLTDLEVAERLYLSRRTINTHLTAIYTKLGVSTRTAAARYAVDHGIV